MCALNFMAIQPMVVEIFHLNPQNVYLMVALEQMFGDHQIKIHPLGTMDVYTKCHGNPSSRH